MLFSHNNQTVPVDDFAKFQTHQTTDEKVMITYSFAFVA